MKLTQKLLALLHRVFDPDPEQFLAMRITYTGISMSWSVDDAVLTTRVNGGAGRNLTIDLTQYTLRQLAAYIAAQSGYSILASGTSEQLSLSARVLIDASGNPALSNGDHLYAYASLTWVYLEAAAAELRAAKAQIPQALNQMSITTASTEWLDELGAYYGVTRQQGENDASYGPRIIAEVVRPRSNNVALEKAISYYTGQSTKVTDVIIYGDAFPIYNGAIRRNSEYLFQASATPRYGLFDVQYGYDLLSGSDQQEFAHRVRSIIDRLRAAGTHLRALSLQAGSIFDTFTPPVDGVIALVVKPGLIDTLTGPTESMGSMAALTAMNDSFIAPIEVQSMAITYSYRYNGLRKRDGKIRYLGGRTVVE